MATRQEQLDENVKRHAQLQKEHPEMDFQPMIALGEKSINLDFDIKVCAGKDSHSSAFSTDMATWSLSLMSLLTQQY